MKSNSHKQVAVLGAGTWGLVLAKILSQNGHAVRSWDFFPAVIEKLKKDRTHPRFQGWKIPEDIALTADLAEALKGVEVVVLAVPSIAVRSICEALREAKLDSAIQLWVICAKGIESESLMPLHAVVGDVLGKDLQAKCCVLSGPSHAEEVAQGLPATVVACSSNPSAAEEAQKLFFQPRFRIYTHDDVLGAELGGSLKNIFAIAAGISDGMGLGDNARAGLITRSLVEMIRLGVAMGARQETFMGLSGIGDLIVTATSRHSRNHQFGELLARGKTSDEALKEVGMVVEGYNTVKAACALGKKFDVEMPISEAVRKVIFDDVPAAKAIQGLLSREAKPEKI